MKMKVGCPLNIEAFIEVIIRVMVSMQHARSYLANYSSSLSVVQRLDIEHFYGLDAVIHYDRLVNVIQEYRIGLLKLSNSRKHLPNLSNDSVKCFAAWLSKIKLLVNALEHYELFTFTMLLSRVFD